MKKLIVPRGCGKTYQLIKESALSGNYIVCYNQKEASRIKAISQELEADIPFLLTYQEFIDKKYYGRGINGFLIDNAEDLLQFLSSVQINMITLSI